MTYEPSAPMTYRPLIGSRRPELLAWILATIVIFAAWFGAQRTGIGLIISIILVAFFSLAAILISIGNWMERKTSISVLQTGISYKNGVRETEFAWSEIKEVRVFPSRLGSKVVVYGQQEFFSYQTLSQISMDGKEKIRYGFEEGEKILSTILNQTDLSSSDKHQADRYYYYLKE